MPPVAEAVGEIQRVVGNHFAPAQGGCFSSPAVAEALYWLQSQGVTGCGQSSWGPTGFALVEDEGMARALRMQIERAGANVVDQKTQASAVLIVVRERSENRVLSVGSSGKATEYELFDEVVFALSDVKGKPLVERQTLRRLPRSGAVVFGIRTYVEPLAEVAAVPATAQALADRIREMPLATAVYKGIAPIREPLLTYLERAAEDRSIRAAGALSAS